MKTTVPLGDIADINIGYPFRSGVSDNPSGTVSVVQMRDVLPPATIDWHKTARVLMEKNMEQYLLQDDDILFVMRGGVYRAICTGIVPFHAMPSPHFFRVRLLENQAIEPTFLAWQLNQPPAQRHYSSIEAGSVQKSLRLADFAELPIMLPPLDRQHKILQAVNCIYKDIASLQAGIKNRETLLTGIACKELT